MDRKFLEGLDEDEKILEGVVSILYGIVKNIKLEENENTPMKILIEILSKIKELMIKKKEVKELQEIFTIQD